jgi:hypothetical protein
MHTLLITLAVIVGLFVLVCVLAGLAGLYDRIFYPHGHDVPPARVREELEWIIDGKHPRALDDFVSCRSFKDPRLEAMRQRVAQLDAEFPPESKGEYCNPKGIEVIRGYIRELEHETAA